MYPQIEPDPSQRPPSPQDPKGGQNTKTSKIRASPDRQRKQTTMQADKQAKHKLEGKLKNKLSAMALKASNVNIKSR
jgi:hypothetical protein